MKNYRLTKKLTAAALGAALIMTTIPCAAAGSYDTSEAAGNSVSETTAEATSTPQPSPESSAEPEETARPEQTPSVSVRVNATVYETSNNNEYRVVFQTGSGLPEINGFSFTASFENASINSVSFGDSFTSNGETSRSVTDDTSVTYTWTNGTTPVSGSVVLSSATIASTSAVGSDSISLGDFTATLTSGETIIIDAELRVIEGEEIPELSENEQSVYDALAALPATEALTFYRDKENGSLYNIESYYLAPIDAALESYDSLSGNGKTHVDTALSASGRTIVSINSLRRAAQAMADAYPVMQMLSAYDGIENNTNALNYEFLKTAYEAYAKDVNTDLLSRAPQAAQEYSEAAESITEYNTYIQSAREEIESAEEIDYNTIVASLDVQFSKANTLSAHSLYAQYIAAIGESAQNLYDEINENYSGSYKEYMLRAVQDIIDSVEAGSDVYRYLPTFKLESGINVGYSFSVSVSRTTPLRDHDATVRISTYSADGELIQQSEEEAFDSGKTSLTVTMYASSSTYSVGETVTVRAYYRYNGVDYYLGETSTTTYKNANLNSITGSGSGNGFSSGGSSTGTGTSTYPTPGPDSQPTPTAAPSMADDNPYTDLDGYDWALESIIGLTNAGIVNGMGDNEFWPASDVTREQFCKMVVQMLGITPDNTETGFGDVDKTQWYAPYVSAAVSAGIVQGQSDEYFGIGESIMRQDMATILYRAINRTGNAAALDFTDSGSIAAYATDAVAELVGLGIMNGYEDGSFKPRGVATRAEASKVIWETYKILN